MDAPNCQSPLGRHLARVALFESIESAVPLPVLNVFDGRQSFDIHRKELALFIKRFKIDFDCANGEMLPECLS
jgi:hypothetical protein